MGEYEYHANPIDWHKPSMAAGKGKKAGESAVFKPPLAGRVGSLFNKIEVSTHCNIVTLNLVLALYLVCNKLCCSLGSLFLSLPNITKHLDVLLVVPPIKGSVVRCLVSSKN